MANSQRGEFELKLDGKSYTLKLGTAALVEFQELFAPPSGGSPPSLVELQHEIKKGRVKYVRALLWAGFRKYHPEITIDDCNDIMDGAEPDEVLTLLGKLGMTTQPAKEDLADLGVNGRPTPAATVEDPGRQTRKRKRLTNIGGRSTLQDAPPD
jgi:hypothetical protein